MKNIAPKLKWNFEFDEEIPDLNIKIPLEKKKKKIKVEILKPKKHGRDSSTNTRLF